MVFTLLALIFVPAGIYALYVIGQLEHVRNHNLRGLDSAAQAAAGLLENARTNVRNLIDDQAYACMFFERQTRLKLLEPTTCRDLKDIDPDFLPLEVVGSSLQIVGYSTAQTRDATKANENTRQSTNKPVLRIEIVLGALLDEIPFGATFDQLFIVNETGGLLGSTISPRRSSPMLPPGVDVGMAPPPIRVVNLSTLRFAGSSKQPPVNFDGFGTATFVHTVEVAGTRYTLMCQPWRVAFDARRANVATWGLCGLIDGQRSFRQALEVAPYIVTLLLVLLTLAVVSWPILKALSLAPCERTRFADMYLILLSTLTLVMLLAVGVADVGTYASLRERSRHRLATLAAQIESNLRAEFAHMYDQLRDYDDAVSQVRMDAEGARKAVSESQPAIRVGCLLLPPDQRGPGDDCQGSSGPLPLPAPDKYVHLQSVFWMRPCDGRQIVKATVLPSNTPAVALGAREYFKAVKRDRFWRVAKPAQANDASNSPEPLDEFFVETSASLTTGEFFAALSIPSRLTQSHELAKALAAASHANDQLRPPRCQPPEDERFGAVLTGQPVSVRYPILAPGVGFAIADQDGRVLFHSDERRAVFENLFADDGVATRLRAALAARTDANFYSHYQTRSHQIHVHPIPDLPWSVLTFVDDEVLRTLHIELLARTAVLVTIYLLLALLGTLLYMLFHGREPPMWLWPRRERRYREIYHALVWSLVVQLIVFLLGHDLLRGETLVLACLLLPLPALGTVVLAARAAQRLNEEPAGDAAPETYRAAVIRRQRWISTIVAALTVVLLAASIAAMRYFDPTSAALVRIGSGTAVLVLLLLLLIAAPAVALAWERRASTPRAAQPGARTRQRPWMRWWRDPLAPHIIGTTVIWLLLGALPAYGLFKFALASQMTVVTKQEQTYLARAFARRGCRIQDDFRLIPTPDDGVRTRRIEIPPTGATGSSSGYSDIYPGALLSRDVEVWPSDLDSLDDADDQVVAAELWTYLANVAPVYNETTTWSRYLAPFVGPADDSGAPPVASRWSWRFTSDVEPLLLYEHDATTVCDTFVPTIASRWPLNEPRLGWVGLIATIAFLSLLFAWVSYGARKLFFGDIEEDARPNDCAPVALGDLPLDRHLGRLGQAPDLAWAKAEVAPILNRATPFPDKTLEEWCSTCTTRRAVVDRILDKVRPFYDSLWQKCSEDEKLLLIQLVDEGFANPKQTEIVRKLLKDGLLRRDPALCPMNHSFAVFVEASIQPEEVRRKEKAHHGVRWNRVRGLLIAALVLILVFLSFTQRDIVEVWIAYLGTAVAGAAGVMKVLSMLNRPSVQKPD